MRNRVAGILKRAQWTKSKSRAVPKELSKKNACYVLITCKEPSEDGKMQVEMTYEGDACLAAFLIESAQGFIDSHVNPS